MPNPGEWDFEYIADLTGGLATDQSPLKIKKNQLANVTGLRPDQGQLLIDTGYVTWGDAVRGIPRLSYQYTKTTGVSELILITDATFYRWTAGEWQYVSDGNATTCTDGEPAGEVNIVVGSITGLSDGDYIGITLDNGTQHQTTINGAPGGTTVVITDAIPTGRSVAAAAIFVKAVDLNGSLDILPNLVVYPNNNWLVFTNGVDVPRYYDSAECVVVPNLPASGVFLAKTVHIFNNHLVFMHTTEGGTVYPQRVRRSDTGDFSEWTTGNAGYDDLLDTSDFIIGGAKLGSYLIAYKEKTIVRIEWVGTDDRLFNYNTIITGHGIVSQNAIIDIGDGHIIISNDNIYKYRGDYSLEPIGESVYNTMFGNTGEIDPTYKKRSFGFYVEELSEAWFFFPTAGNTAPNKLLRYSLVDKSWWPREFASNFVGFGYYKKTNAVTWATATGTWAEQQGKWNSSSLLANSPTILLCDAANLQVVEYDYTNKTDNNTAITYVMETKDFYNPNYKTRLDFLDLMLKGNLITIDVSINQGDTWDNIAEVSPGVMYQKVRVDRQIIGETLRFRLSGSSGFGLDWIGFKYLLESEF